MLFPLDGVLGSPAWFPDTSLLEVSRVRNRPGGWRRDYRYLLIRLKARIGFGSLTAVVKFERYGNRDSELLLGHLVTELGKRRGTLQHVEYRIIQASVA